MRTDDFDFDLPSSFVAQRPIKPRDAARLLEVGERVRDLGVRDLPDLLRPGDVAVFNDTRVIPTRLWGRRGQARHRSPSLWHAPSSGSSSACLWEVCTTKRKSVDTEEPTWVPCRAGSCN